MINYNTPILAQLKFAVAISSIKVILQPLVFMVIVAGFLHQFTRVLKPDLKRLAFNLIHILPRRRSSNIRQE